MGRDVARRTGGMMMLFRSFILCLSLITPLAAQMDGYDPETINRDQFRNAEPGYVFEFPRDHGSHPEYSIEWWYFTGHLFEATDGTRFGFQATFFRTATAQEDYQLAAQTPYFGASQFYMAHMGILNTETGEYLTQDRFNRNGWDAYAKVGEMDVRNGNWHLKMVDTDEEILELKGSVHGRYAFDLVLTPLKDKVLFGENGISMKGEDSASLYITFPRLDVKGTLYRDGETVKVGGQAWMDHEISSSQLSDTQEGWDWTQIQLDDGSEIMMYILREEGGDITPYSTLTWIAQDGTLHAMKPDRFSWVGQRTWTSPVSGATYPVDYLLTFEHPLEGQVTLNIRPLQDNQEFQTSVPDLQYYEASCDVYRDGVKVGKAFVELTGYGTSMAGRL
jgi:predicted secreted hydrolase